MIKKIIAGCFAVGALFTVQCAAAADLSVAPLYKAPPSEMTQAYNWTGFYLGANGGGGWGHSWWQGTSSGVGPVSYTHLDVYKRQHPLGARDDVRRLFDRGAVDAAPLHDLLPRRPGDPCRECLEAARVRRDERTVDDARRRLVPRQERLHHPLQKRRVPVHADRHVQIRKWGSRCV